MKRLLTLAFSVIVLGAFQQPLSAQSTPAYYETVRMGRGAVQRIQWQTHGDYILADTIRGAWIYRPSGSNLVDVTHLEDARLARFRPDGRVLAGVNEQNAITLWNTTVFTQTMSLRGHTAYVRALEWSPDGSKIASADRDGTVLVWDATNAKQLLKLHLNGADKLAWSHSGTYLAGEASQSRTVNVWDSAGKLGFASTSFGANLLWRNDTQLLSPTDDETPEGPLWDMQTGQQAAIVRHGYGTGYNSDGSKLASSNIGQAFIADGTTGATLSRIDGPQALVVKWSPNDHYVAFGDWSTALGTKTHVRIVDAVTGEIVADFLFDATITGIAWNSDSTGFVIVDSASRIIEQLLDPSSAFPSKTLAHTDIGTLADWHSDGQAIAVADTNDGVRIWDAGTGDPLTSQMSLGQPVHDLAWQPKGNLLAMDGGTDWQSLYSTTFIWDTTELAGPDIEPVFVIPHLDQVAGIAWSPDGKTLTSAERTRYLRLWSPERPHDIHVIDLWTIRLAPFVDYSQRIETLEWPANSRFPAYSFASSGNGGGVQLIDLGVDAGAIIPADTPQNYDSTWAWTVDHRFISAAWGYYGDPGPTPSAQDITVKGQGVSPLLLKGLSSHVAKGIFSPDARSLIGFDDLNHGIIWDIATQKARIQLTDVHDAVWSPDSTKIVVYKTDGEIEILNALTGKVIYTFTQHFRTGRIQPAPNVQVIWSPDSQKIALLDSGALFIYQAS